MPPSKKKTKEEFDMLSGTFDIIEIDEGRHNYFSFRVTDDEKIKIENKIAKSKLKKSDYLRKCALEKEIVVVENIRELTLELKKLGNNINQITKAIHSGSVEDSAEFRKIESQYNQLFEALLKTLKKV